jgi:hypothetical protein
MTNPLLIATTKQTLEPQTKFAKDPMQWEPLRCHVCGRSLESVGAWRICGRSCDPAHDTHDIQDFKRFTRIPSLIFSPHAGRC